MQLQLIYDETVEKKLTRREIRKEYQLALENQNEYIELSEQIKKLNEKRKQVQERVQARMGKQWEKFGELKGEVDEQNRMMTDQAMTDLIEGKTVLVKDQWDNEYEPVWSVRFKRK